MPHQCTECGHVFPDGSKEMLSGCPDCGGNKFQFRPASDARDTRTDSDPSTESEPSSESEPSTETEPTAHDTSETASSSPDPSGSEPAPTEPEKSAANAGSPSTEDTATSASTPETSDGTDAGPAADSSPDHDGSPPETMGDNEDHSEQTDPTETDDSEMATLRRELNDQFESIKILEPGQYELNLMELYNREERIIALQEDGQYVIDVPDTWLGDDDS
ncbi:OapC/ArvC family zinc-ribbon domain-containing protein [Halococcus saccharolyticus]|uniref:Origin-associated protein OapC n=1 Tax=Halococcus saccharolyticus DSM 5350 TaxID=1227455 RepID=M0MDF5_9EURY|nr:Zn-ribbon containing protein [Halococcus saccharolyticus]EMA42694.1 hypothetical protein C449_16168 [Halococcus saccharolyticus DSM 5350]